MFALQVLDSKGRHTNCEMNFASQIYIGGNVRTAAGYWKWNLNGLYRRSKWAGWRPVKAPLGPTSSLEVAKVVLRSICAVSIKYFGTLLAFILEYFSLPFSCFFFYRYVLPFGVGGDPSQRQKLVVFRQGHPSKITKTESPPKRPIMSSFPALFWDPKPFKKWDSRRSCFQDIFGAHSVRVWVDVINPRMTFRVVWGSPSREKQRHTPLKLISWGRRKYEYGHSIIPGIGSFNHSNTYACKIWKVCMYTKE